jgi:D-alanyl-D-alanine carboxypeptidase (penicillin-binding protein 5/6)
VAHLLLRPNRWIFRRSLRPFRLATWVLMDYTTGQILTAGNEHQQRNPASLTKLMTGYVVDRAIDSHRITPDDIVTVGRDAWAKGNPVLTVHR